MFPIEADVQKNSRLPEGTSQDLPVSSTEGNGTTSEEAAVAIIDINTTISKIKPTEGIGNSTNTMTAAISADEAAVSGKQEAAVEGIIELLSEEFANKPFCVERYFCIY